MSMWKDIVTCTTHQHACISTSYGDIATWHHSSVCNCIRYIVINKTICHDILLHTSLPISHRSETSVCQPSVQHSYLSPLAAWSCLHPKGSWGNSFQVHKSLLCMWRLLQEVSSLSAPWQSWQTPGRPLSPGEQWWWGCWCCERHWWSPWYEGLPK